MNDYAERTRDIMVGYFVKIAWSHGVNVLDIVFDKASNAIEKTIHQHVDDGSLSKTEYWAQAWGYAQEAWREYTS